MSYFTHWVDSESLLVILNCFFYHSQFHKCIPDIVVSCHRGTRSTNHRPLNDTEAQQQYGRSHNQLTKLPFLKENRQFRQARSCKQDNQWNYGKSITSKNIKQCYAKGQTTQQ